MSALDILHWLAGLIVLAESLNKLERIDLLRPDSSPIARLADVLKTIAWFFLAIGAAGAVVGPFLPSVGLPAPGFGDVLVMLGFATLVVRTRVEEGEKR